MKKLFLILLMLLFSFQTLTGCVAHPDLSNSSSSSSYMESSANSNALTFCGQSTDHGYYNINPMTGERANITYIDYDQKEEIFLCAKPECFHDNDTCLSSIILDESMSVPALCLTENDLLLIQTQPNQTSNSHIEIADLNGNNRRLLCEFPSNYVLSTKLYTDQQDVYLFVDVINTQNTVSTKKMISVNLKSGKIKDVYLYPENETALYIAGSLDRKLIIASIQFDENNSAYTVYNFLDVDEGKLDETPLASIQQSTTGSFIENDYLYTIVYSEQQLNQRNLKNGESDSFDFSLICDSLEDSFDPNNISVFMIDNNVFRIEIPVFTVDDTIFREFIFDAKEKSFQNFSLLKKYNGDVITILDEDYDRFLVRVDWIEGSRNSSNGEPYTIFVPQYAFIDKVDFKNSIENYDFISSDIY